MTAFVLDDAAAADRTLARVADAARTLGLKPGLAVVLVGSDPASQVYVAAKGKAREALRLPLARNSTCPRPQAKRNCWR